MNIIGIIPARLAATRLPDKPLLDIAGKPMIQRVWERAKQAQALKEIYIATPDERIREAAESFGAIALMTKSSHRSGTDRLAEAAALLDAEIIVNIQGDEPLIEPEYIERAVAPLLSDPSLLMSSLMCPCPDDEVENPATVKVVAATNGDALYFSRARIPYPRSVEAAVVMQHIGLYAYRKEFLVRFPTLEPTPLEKAESLEQLRALENGIRIRMVDAPHAPLSVDTPEDLVRVRAIFADNDSENSR